ncbi:PSD1 and planctomycete cytochrome C domain-containing protein [Paraglaciecola aquimarina]|uniref:PSD1 and planctomycete cytochrome C domain-containing protein n=1 Tax=Paraglaciecola aquimarina TaxID=1235557 RepID=A0ABU3SRE6_9ALTE|nr:PSD1 and planctomycete cytochrome C domain-containing protein [Paraglaciecola aquimarina]MDU0352572.1 PSD1 and planctomycete cytochrome C domain-containing protein [Paraglaciecola aquimarina]
MKYTYLLIPVVLLAAYQGFSHKSENSVQSPTISFNQHIRPILNESCTGCHGGVSKQSNVSFIYREEALARGHSGRLTIVPGDPDASELIARIEATDPNIRMPYKAPALSAEKIQLLRDWIEQGAEWEEHWAFIQPKIHQVPKTNNTNVINNEIDAFLQAKLEATKFNNKPLTLTDTTDKTTLLRRASFDLTGLPPTLAEIDEFLADDSKNAFEKQVDRLLASPRYGERWAAMWMDLARYADSHGYTRDEYRETWPYKQWVIQALNANQSYKHFVIEQLAGDLMPNRSLDNIIASGFHRQTPSNSEGGTDDEEFRMVAVMDRSATTWSMLNAITMNCVQCHAHPYDPIEHDEYYQSLSFFNTTKDSDYRDYKPLYKLAKNEQQQQQAFEVQEKMSAIARHEAHQAFMLSKQTDESASPWQKLKIETAVGDEYRGLNEYISGMQKVNEERKAKGQTPNYQYIELIKVGTKRLAELEQQGLRKFTVKDGEYFDPGKYEARVYYHFTTEPFDGATSISSLRMTAMPQDPIKARHSPETRFQIDDVTLYVVKKNGQKHQLAIESFMSNSTEVMDKQLTNLAQLPDNHDGLSTGKGVGWLAHRIYLPRWSTAVLAEPLTLVKGDRIEVELTQMQEQIAGDLLLARLHRVKLEVTDYSGWTEYVASDKRLNNIRQYGTLSEQLSQIDSFAMPVILEQDEWDNRGMAKFNRGNMIAKVGPLLDPGTPAIFPMFTQQQTRLGLAQWFFQPEQPLTARVAVNRLWHRLFGIGIVETLEDFGSAGSAPSHPELLDWLALKFQEDLNWDMKAMLKFMVMSHAYQQNSTVSQQLIEFDPHNQLFARGPRQRLSAEMIRDQALVASGLIVHKIGGEPVMPPSLLVYGVTQVKK